MFISKNEVISNIEKAIENRLVLSVIYQHTTDGERVVHKIAPFDIGSSNPQNRERFANNLYAYSFTHRNENNLPNPKVCAFNINNFLNIEETDEIFDETELAKLNFQTTRYDYRNCNFALLPNRNWFK
jgi:hypothetical protein